MSTHLHVPLAPDTSSSGQFISAAIAAVWRRKVSVLGIVIAALLLGIAAAVLIPPRYTARAIIRGEFVAPDTLLMQVKNVSTGSVSAGPMSLDLVRVIETQSRLLQSNRLARRVVEQIGLDRLQPLLGQRGWILDVLHRSATQKPEDLLDLDGAAGRLLNGLTVTSDPRAYLITVHYRTGDPGLSVLVANAFAAELIRTTRLQVLFQQSYTTQAQLSTQLAKFGEKHPRVAVLRKQLTATDDAMKRQMSESAEGILQAAGENVTQATDAAPSPTRSFVLSLSLLLGLMSGMGIALWLERRRWWIA
jgi:uncharacterized protein involved in exopolysaccharide biosynthesis